MAKRSSQAPALKQPLLPTSARVHELYREHFLGREGVEGCFVGRKRVGGKQTRELAIVCGVRQKRAARELEASSLVPERVTWDRGVSEEVRVSTDVQKMGKGTLHDAPTVAGPGDLLAEVTFPNQRPREIIATLGVAMRHPRHGLVVTTAGHAVQGGPGEVTFPPGQEPQVRIRNVGGTGAGSAFVGRLVRSVRVEEADYALLAPVDGTPVRNLYQDTDTLTGLHLPHPDDVGKTFFALTAKGLQPAAVHGVFGVLTLGGFRLRDLVLTDPVTSRGDSGCALIDPLFRVCGLLVGATTVNGARRSVFMSAFWALNLEKGELF